jgi:hypothetical protein
MAVTVLLDDGTGSDNGIVSVLTPVNLPQRSAGAHVALQLSSTTNAGLGVSALMASSADAQQEQQGVVLHVGSVYLSLKAATARIASRILVAVSTSVLVWYFPVRATALIVTLTVIVSAFELSWFAARVTNRLVTAFYKCEAIRDQINDRRAANMTLNGSKAGSNIEEALLNIRAGVDGTIATPMLAERESEADSNATSQINTQLQRDQALPISTELESLIAPIASKFFCGKQWFAAAVLALPLAGLLVLVEVTAIRAWKTVPSSSVLTLSSDADADDFVWSLVYLATTRLVASICSLLAPSALGGLLLLVELELFSTLSMLALSCRVGVVICSSFSGAGFLSVFVVGVGALLCANAIGNEEPVAIAVSPALSVSGFLWAHCLGVVAMSLIPSDTDKSSGSDAGDTAETARNLLVTVIASISAADVGSLLWQTTIGRFWDQSTPIQRRLSVSIDVESALVGVGCGVLVVVALTQLISLPNGGPVLDYVLLTLAAVSAARAAELVLVLLKRAAGGGRSPVTDHSAGLLAGALVFAQYARGL